MTHTITIASANAFSNIQQCGFGHMLLSDGRAVYDSNNNALNISADVEQYIVDGIADTAERANMAWAAPSENDPLATEAQLKLISDLETRRAVQILNIQRLDKSAITKSQASRLIDGAYDLINSGA